MIQAMDEHPIEMPLSLLIDGLDVQPRMLTFADKIELLQGQGEAQSHFTLIDRFLMCAASFGRAYSTMQAGNVRYTVSELSSYDLCSHWMESAEDDCLVCVCPEFLLWQRALNTAKYEPVVWMV